MAQQIVVVAIRDRLADVFSQPMFFATTGQAIRAFQDALADPQNHMSKHPEDYDMYHLAHFDDQTGRFTNAELGNVTPIAIAKQLKLSTNHHADDRN